VIRFIEIWVAYLGIDDSMFMWSENVVWSETVVAVAVASFGGGGSCIFAARCICACIFVGWHF